MTGYSEYRFWSPTLGCDAARLSMFDEHGGEFYMIVPCEEGRVYREKRQSSLEIIAAAIGMGLDPGEVRTQ